MTLCGSALSPSRFRHIRPLRRHGRVARVWRKPSASHAERNTQHQRMSTWGFTKVEEACGRWPSQYFGMSGDIVSCRSSKSGLYASICEELVTSVCPKIGTYNY
eukprot:s1385_g29.t1